MPLPASSGSTVPDSIAPPPGNPRFPLADSVRALAALSILMLHTAVFSGESWYSPALKHLDVGVAMFFVLSGFLLYRPFVAARILGAPRSRILDYGRRRFLRIFPAYWIALTAVAVLLGVTGVLTGNWWVYYGLLQIYPIYTETSDCLAESLNCGIVPAWSLAVEVGFYVTLPFLALGIAWLVRRAKGVRWVWIDGVVLALISVVSVPIALGLDGDLGRWLFFSPLGFGLWFALGMGLAVLSVRVQQTGNAPTGLRWLSERSLIPWALAAALYAIACLFVEPGGIGPDVEYRYLLFGLISALVLLPAVFGDPLEGLPRKVLSLPLLAWLGLISYGIFLWHWPVAFALTDAGVVDWIPSLGYPVLAAATLAITLTCATLSYYLVERPLMRFKNRSG